MSFMDTHQNLKFISPTKLIDGWDVSRSFLWRLEQAGLITPCYLYSRKLYAVKEVERIEKMITAGELQSALRGAAGKSNSRLRQKKAPKTQTVNPEAENSSPEDIQARREK